MTTPVLVISIVLIVTVIIGLTGLWRFVFWPFRINVANMNARALGFRVSKPEDVERVNAICRAFAGGFNAMISQPSNKAWLEFCDSESAFYRPFAQEGAAMGYPLRQIGRFSSANFEREIVAQNPEFSYLHCVGLGFWHAMRGRGPAKLERIVGQLDPLHGMLCWDGYGFKHGFFDFGDTESYTRAFAGLEGFAARVAHQGLGRSLWFRYLNEPDALVTVIGSLKPFEADVASGVGLATAFAAFDRPTGGRDVLHRMPDAWHSDVMLGMCFGYKARALADASFFEIILEGYDPSAREAIRLSIDQCDLIESETRRLGASEGYRRWREQLATWLADHVEYPFLNVKNRATVAAERLAASEIAIGERT